MMLKCLSAILSAAVAAAVLVSCNDGKVYDKYVPTPVAGWEKNDTLTYNIPSVASAGLYQSWLGLRIADSYPFTAITMVVEQHVLPADTVIIDTLDCRLTDDSGIYIGSGINSYQYSFHVADIRLRQGDSLYVRVRHNMKREILPGVSDVGMTLKSR